MITMSTGPALSDHELLTLCAHYGSQAKFWKQKFLGLLPEVNKRKLYEQKGCSSIFEFAAKLGGVSREQVLITLRLYNRFEFIPVLKQALVSGDISVNKLARVVSVATPGNQQFLATQAHLLSKTALETLVKDMKSLPGQTFSHATPQRIPQSDELNLSTGMRRRLLVLQNKGINLEELMEQFLDQRDKQIQQEKKRLGEELDHKPGVGPRQEVGVRPFKPSRYIPMKVKHLLTQEFGTKCAHEKCVNRSINLHHTKRFSIDPSHNPFYLAPLCKQHHEIAHAVDVRATEFRRR